MLRSHHLSNTCVLMFRRHHLSNTCVLMLGSHHISNPCVLLLGSHHLSHTCALMSGSHRHFFFVCTYAGEKPNSQSRAHGQLHGRVDCGWHWSAPHDECQRRLLHIGGLERVLLRHPRLHARRGECFLVSVSCLLMFPFYKRFSISLYSMGGSRRLG